MTTDTDKTSTHNESADMKTKAYRGGDGVLYRVLIEPKLIHIVRAEGPTDECGIKKTCQNFAQAADLLMSNARTAPKCGGYDKHDFTVEYEDGYLYEGRYDLKHYSCELPDLAKHMRETVEWIANNEMSARFYGHEYVEQVREFLQKYSVDQKPIPINVHDEDYEVIKDYTTTIAQKGRNPR
jgi:hypothetical protein